MSRPVIFVDTNCADNRSSASAFLGNRVELQKVAKRAKIILPKVVRDEIARHVQEFLSTQLNAMKRNPYRYHLNIKDEHLRALDFNKILSNLEENEEIAFQVLDISNKAAAYEEIYKHAIDGTPPFEPNGDKGFKDALIAKTVDEYVMHETGERIFVMTKDARLAEYFSKNDTVTVIATYADFDSAYSFDKFDDILLNRVLDFLSAEEDSTVSVTLQNHWLNWDDELIGLLDGTTGAYCVRVDPQYKEPVDYTKVDIEGYLNNLDNTSSIDSAHENISHLVEVIHFLSEPHTLRVYESFRKNDQIYSIGEDDDIRQAAQDLVTILDGFTLHREADNVRIQYNLMDAAERLDEEDFNDIDDAAGAWIEMQGDIARGK